MAVGRLRHLSPRASSGAAAEPKTASIGRSSGLALLLKYGLLQLRTWRKAYPGTLHAMIFWGFIVLTIATTVVMIDYDFGIPIMRGRFYLYFQSLIVDVFGALAIVGVGMAAVRRWIARPKQLVYTHEASRDPGRDLRDPGHRLSGRRLADRGHRRSLGRLVAVRQSGRRGLASR